MSGDENVERASEPGTDPGNAAAADAPAGISVRVAGSTAVGLVREHNEDNFAVADLNSGAVRPRDEVCEDDVDEHGLMFAVCDGMGGAAAGEVASKMAVEILVEAMRRGGPPADRDALARRLVRAVEEAGKRIYEAAQKERSRRGMGTTATVAVLVDKVMFIAEVGDSRAYLLRRGELKQLTKDQSLVNQLIEAGHLTEDEAEAFEHSNIILQALGTSESVQVDLTFVELRKGDRLMMCSDGLSGLVHADVVRQAMAEIEEPAECAAKLIEYAEQGGGHDNITVIVADFTGDDLPPPTDNDTFGYLQYPLPLEEGQSSAFVDEDTTSGARPRASAAAEASDGFEGGDEEGYESTYPAPADEGEGSSSLWWLVGGVAALAVAGVVWVSIEPVPTTRAVEEAPLPAQAAPAAEPEPVRVNVHTDVERATLLVNGESKGELSTDRSRTLFLRPGAYRFEAQSEGSPAAVTVQTVRGDTPMDVFLQLPTGTSESAEDEAPLAGEGEGGDEADEREAAPDALDAEGTRGERGAPAEALAAEDSAATAAERERKERRAAARKRRAERRAAAEAAAVEGSATSETAPAPEAKPADRPQTGPQAKPKPEPQAEAKPEPTAPAAAPTSPEGIPDNPF